MKGKILLKISVNVILLGVSLKIFAFSNTPIPCPPLTFISSHAANVNAVQIVKKNDYAVYTSLAFYDAGSKMKWQIGTDVYTHDFDTAFEIGSKRIQNTVNQIDLNAEYLVDFWLCLYADQNQAFVYVTSPINPDVDWVSNTTRKSVRSKERT